MTNNKVKEGIETRIKELTETRSKLKDSLDNAQHTIQQAQQFINEKTAEINGIIGGIAELEKSLLLFEETK